MTTRAGNFKIAKKFLEMITRGDNFRKVIREKF